MIFSLAAVTGLEKCCITSAYLQWLCHSGERPVVRGPLVFFFICRLIEEKRCTGGGKRYCSLCTRKENEVTKDGLKVTLHHLPGGQSKDEIARRKSRVRGLKLHRPNIPITDSTRVCILHFENHVYVKGQSVPKHYNLNKRPEKKKTATCF